MLFKKYLEFKQYLYIYLSTKTNLNLKYIYVEKRDKPK